MVELIRWQLTEVSCYICKRLLDSRGSHQLPWKKKKAASRTMPIQCMASMDRFGCYDMQTENWCVKPSSMAFCNAATLKHCILHTAAFKFWSVNTAQDSYHWILGPPCSLVMTFYIVHLRFDIYSAFLQKVAFYSLYIHFHLAQWCSMYSYCIPAAIKARKSHHLLRH